MASYPHPSPDSEDWDNPDFCPFCGEEVTNLGNGFMEHIEGRATCRKRFEEWRDNIMGDMEGEWGG
jgi:hypothetical protein